MPTGLDDNFRRAIHEALDFARDCPGSRAKRVHDGLCHALQRHDHYEGLKARAHEQYYVTKMAKYLKDDSALESSQVMGWVLEELAGLIADPGTTFSEVELEHADAEKCRIVIKDFENSDHWLTVETVPGSDPHGHNRASSPAPPEAPPHAAARSAGPGPTDEREPAV